MRIKYATLILIMIVLALSACGGGAPGPSDTNGATTSLAFFDYSGSPGSTVDVPLDIRGASDVGAMGIVLTYDPSVLGVSDVVEGDLTGNSMLAYDSAVPGILGISIADADGISGDGSLVVILFSVIGELGDTSPLTLEVVEANDVETLLEIPTSVTSGTFTVA
jgi:hypothetical protein